MRKMKVCRIGMNFKKEELVKLPIMLLENSEILSVEVENDNQPTLWINYMVPSEDWLNANEQLWCEFQFIIAECNYVDVEIDEHKYINTVCIEDSNYVVFYKKIQSQINKISN